MGSNVVLSSKEALKYGVEKTVSAALIVADKTSALATATYTYGKDVIQKGSAVVAENSTAIEEVVVKATPVGFKFSAKALPVIGGVVSAVSGASEVSHVAYDAWHGQASWRKVANTVDSAIDRSFAGSFGFGASEVVQHMDHVRQVALYGEENAAPDSSAYILAKQGIALGQQAYASMSKPTSTSLAKSGQETKRAVALGQLKAGQAQEVVPSANLYGAIDTTAFSGQNLAEKSAPATTNNADPSAALKAYGETRERLAGVSSLKTIALAGEDISSHPAVPLPPVAVAKADAAGAPEIVKTPATLKRPLQMTVLS
jgi:hypothetical protein